MTSDDKRKSAPTALCESQERDHSLVAPERIPDTLDNVLDKLFSTTPEQIEEWENQKPQSTEEQQQ